MLRVGLLSGLCALALVACTESHVTDVDAGGIVLDVDATVFMDAGQDAGMPSGIGEACSTDEDCTGLADTCASSGFFEGGYCTLPCTESSECGDMGTCVNFGRGTQICLATCSPDSSPRECRAGYGCSTNPMLAGVCLPGCTDDTDCSAGEMCDPNAGFAGTCFDPSAGVGDPCADEAECPMGGFCLSEGEYGWSSGSCVSIGCNLSTDTGCTGDAHCIDFGDPVCIDGCTSSDDCRAGYACRESGGHMVCLPGCERAPDGSSPTCSSGRECNPALGTCATPFDGSLLGNTCSRFRGGCEGGSCLREVDSGFPGAYCAYAGCTVGDSSTCPSGGACLPTDDGRGLCVDACTEAGDCTRAGYACLPVDPSTMDGAMGCLPACTSADDCANDGFVCNVGTGRCTAPFVDASAGEPCAAAEDCAGGRCLTEASSGYPAGTCAYPGCRLASGSGAGVTCPSGSVCVDDGRGDPTLGHCIDSCTVGDTTCRSGYACVALTMGGTEGSCMPACTDTSCTAPRTCVAATGLCTAP